MANVLLWLAVAAFFLFAFVVLFGAPFLPILKNQIPEAFDLLDLQPGQTLIELGSGDGRMLVAAAQRGIHAVGYELNPLLWLYSWIITRRYKGMVRVHLGDYWRTQWPPADGVFVFLLDKYMPKLDKKITQEYGKNVKLVSLAFKIPGRKISKSHRGLYLYKY